MLFEMKVHLTAARVRCLLRMLYVSHCMRGSAACYCSKRQCRAIDICFHTPDLEYLLISAATVA